MKRFLLIAALCALALSCTQEATLTLSADVPSAQFGPEGGSFNTILFTNGSSWKATCEDPSVVFYPDSGAFTTPMHIEVGENTEHYTKAIRIAVTAKLDESSRYLNLVITQTCRPFVFCEANWKTAGPEVSKVFFTVNSNEGWRVYRTLLDGEDVVLESFPAPSGWIFPYSSERVDPDNQANNMQVTVQLPLNDSGKVRTWEILLATKAEPRTEACRLTILQNP